MCRLYRQPIALCLLPIKMKVWVSIEHLYGLLTQFYILFLQLLLQNPAIHIYAAEAHFSVRQFWCFSQEDIIDFICRERFYFSFPNQIIQLHIGLTLLTSYSLNLSRILGYAICGMYLPSNLEGVRRVNLGLCTQRGVWWWVVKCVA